MEDQFRVRMEGSSGPFVDIDITGASSDNIRLALSDIFSIHGPFYLKKVVQIGPPVQYGTRVIGFHAGIYGSHEIVLIRGKDVSAIIRIDTIWHTLELSLYVQPLSIPRRLEELAMQVQLKHQSQVQNRPL